MPLYTKTPKEMVADLIKEANPSLPLPLGSDGITFGLPKAIVSSPELTQNTEIVLTARAPSGYKGKTTVRYRRIDLGTLFRGLSAEVYKYTASTADQYPFNVYGLLKEINTRFGLNLTSDDVANTWFPWQNDRYYPDRRSSVGVLRALPNSLNYIGETTLRWVSDRQSIADIITVSELSGRGFPGGNVFDPNHKRILNCETYSVDVGMLIPTIDTGWFGATPIGQGDATINGSQQAVFDALATLTGVRYTLDPVTVPFGLYGIRPVKYTLPHPDVPEANSKNFNRVFVLRYPIAGSWGAGNIYLHYNV